jgi:hypothetical protein
MATPRSYTEFRSLAGLMTCLDEATAKDATVRGRALYCVPATGDAVICWGGASRSCTARAFAPRLY